MVAEVKNLVQHCPKCQLPVPKKLLPRNSTKLTPSQRPALLDDQFWDSKTLGQMYTEEEVDHILQDGIIEKSHSPWSRLIILVAKHDGSLLLCNVSWMLNVISKFDSYPLS